MAKKASGGARKIGRNKVKCTRYYSENRRSEHKLKRFMKNNIGKNWPQTQIDKAISKFKDMQYEKHKKHALS